MITIKIQTGGAAFEGDNLNYEVARILRKIADDVESARMFSRYNDINGNGAVIITAELERGQSL